MKHGALISVLMCTAFAMGLAAFIGSRLSEQAVALMAGTLLGLCVALPVGIVIGWAIKSQRQPDRANAPQPTVMMPTTMTAPYPAASITSAVGSSYPIGVWPPPQLPPRKYTIGGEEIVQHEPGTFWQS